MRAFGESTVALYESLLAREVAPEIARCVLPQGMYTEFIETGSLAAYARLFGLRTDPGAQREIQLYAREMGALVAPSFPISWSALSSDATVSAVAPAVAEAVAGSTSPATS